jgi:hypothetical protein
MSKGWLCGMEMEEKVHDTQEHMFMVAKMRHDILRKHLHRC